MCVSVCKREGERQTDSQTEIETELSGGWGEVVSSGSSELPKWEIENSDSGPIFDTNRFWGPGPDFP